MDESRILIVEDESVVALDLRRRLVALGYQVTGAVARGEEALERIREDAPDLVLMDIRLKGPMDGISAAEEIRRESAVPLVYLTAFSEDSTLQRAKLTEPFGYIIKPFQDRELRSIIEMALFKHAAEQRLRESERRYATTLRSIGDGVIATDRLGHVTLVNPVAETLTGWPEADARGRPLGEVFRIVNEATREPVEDPVARVLRENRVVGLANHTMLISRTGAEIPIEDGAAPIYDDAGAITGTVLVFQDGTERREKEAELRRIEWMLSPKPSNIMDLSRGQSYGDLTALNTSRVILDAVGHDILQDIVSDHLGLLETSSAVYERNGDYALAIFASGWCRFMDQAARNRCETPSDVEALASGRWLCHESCWTDCSRASIERDEAVDIECAGGIRLYSVPIRAGDEIVGSINFGYGDPPREAARLRELAEAYAVPEDELRAHAAAYQTRPPFIIEMAKRRLRVSARLIGEIVRRKQAETALVESQARLRSTVANAPVVLFGLDADGVFTFSDGRGLEALGLKPAEVVGSSALELYREFPSVVAALRQVLAGEPAHAIQDLGSLVFDVTYTPVPDQQGRPGGVIGVATDITERHRSELERERLQAQLAQAQKMESVGRLAGGVAHDFNNMLQVIIGNVKIALDAIPLDSPARESLDEIQKSAARSADLTRQLLAFARKQTIAPVVLNLNDTVVGMAKMLRRLIGEEVELLWSLGADLWLARLDATQIDQALINLSVNARDAISGSGRVTIETANVVLDEVAVAASPECEPGEYVMLAVRDSGEGMDEETREHLFEPFFTTKSVGSGTGLGLATVFGIVTQNRGLIQVETARGQGTSVRLYFPRVAGSVAVAPVTRRPSPGGMETILLVEDEEQILQLGRRILEQRGYTVLQAPSPREALAVAAAHPGVIDMLITDVVMPGMNGRALRDELRPLHPGMKVLFISGYTADVIAHHGVLEDGVQFLQKPFSNQDLAETVRAALDLATRPE